MDTAIAITKPMDLTWSVAEQESMIGQSANEHAAAAAFELYRRGKSPGTIAVRRDGLKTFAAFLGEAGIIRTVAQLETEPDAWRFVTHGLVEGFREWMLRAGYAVGTVNGKLTSVKVYVKLATRAGAVSQETYAMIRMIAGIGKKEAVNLDAQRTEAGTPVRVGRKKAGPTHITEDDAKRLLTHPDTPQGRRDNVLMHLLLDMGLRAGEAAGVTVGNVDLEEGTIQFYRSKVYLWQVHELTRGTRAALVAYFEAGDAPDDPDAPLLRGSRKGGHLTDAGMSRVNISLRVRTLGERIGVHGLSAHDCRHFWASKAARLTRDAFALRDAGGWADLTMPSRYVAADERANAGIVHVFR